MERCNKTANWLAKNGYRACLEHNEDILREDKWAYYPTKENMGPCDHPLDRPYPAYMVEWQLTNRKVDNLLSRDFVRTIDRKCKLFSFNDAVKEKARLENSGYRKGELIAKIFLN